MSVPRTKISLLKTVIVVAVGEDAEVGVGDRRVQPAQLRFVVLQDLGDP